MRHTNGIFRVADFGLLKLSNDSVDKGFMGTKWMAPEVIIPGLSQLSTKSDVWSFGILLWELVTYGRVPYPGMANREVQEEVKQGYRMPCPPNTPESLYQIMLDCWKEIPADRPTFETLQWRLEDFFLQDSVVNMYVRDMF